MNKLGLTHESNLDKNYERFEMEGSVNNALLKDGERYGGLYVATKSFKDKKLSAMAAIRAKSLMMQKRKE